MTVELDLVDVARQQRNRLMLMILLHRAAGLAQRALILCHQLGVCGAPHGTTAATCALLGRVGRVTCSLIWLRLALLESHVEIGMGVFRRSLLLVLEASKAPSPATWSESIHLILLALLVAGTLIGCPDSDQFIARISIVIGRMGSHRSLSLYTRVVHGGKMKVLLAPTGRICSWIITIRPDFYVLFGSMGRLSSVQTSIVHVDASRDDDAGGRSLFGGLRLDAEARSRRVHILIGEAHGCALVGLAGGSTCSARPFRSMITTVPNRPPSLLQKLASAIIRLLNRVVVATRRQVNSTNRMHLLAHQWVLPL